MRQPPERVSDDLLPMAHVGVIARVRFLDCLLVVTIRGDLGGDGDSDNIFLYPTRIQSATLIDSDGGIIHVESELESDLLDLFEGRIVCGSLDCPELKTISVACASGRYDFVEQERY